MIKYYLISRISREYHKKHEELTNMIEGVPFIPHLNNPTDIVHDKLSYDIFKKDCKAMEESHFGVVSLPIGEDCSSEIGWYAGNNKPVFCIIRTLEEYENLKSIWMVKGFLTCCFVVNDKYLFNLIKKNDPILKDKIEFMEIDEDEKIRFSDIYKGGW